MVEELARLHRELPAPDGALRHPRPERGADAGRPHRHHARRPARRASGRRAASIAARPTASPPSSWAAPTCCRSGARRRRRTAGAGRVVSATAPAARDAPRPLGPAADCLLCVRPHDLEARRRRTSGANRLDGTVGFVALAGRSSTASTLDVEGATCASPAARCRTPPRPARCLAVHFAAEDATLIADERSAVTEARRATRRAGRGVPGGLWIAAAAAAARRPVLLPAVADRPPGAHGAGSRRSLVGPARSVLGSRPLPQRAPQHARDRPRRQRRLPRAGLHPGAHPLLRALSRARASRRG